jgi:hypothetical protein
MTVLMMEAVHTSETLVHFSDITRYYVPEDSKLLSLITSMSIREIRMSCIYYLYYFKGVSILPFPLTGIYSNIYKDA